MFTVSDTLSISCIENHSQFHHIQKLLQRPSVEFIENVHTKIKVLTYQNQSWALTVNKKEYNNALICSPYTTYITYPLQELKKFNKLWIRALVLLNSMLMGALCRATKFNQVVQVNNNLNSLIKHPALFANHMHKITTSLIETNPAHAINFFRVNNALDAKLLAALKGAGYLVFPDRVAHVFFPEKKYMKRSHTKRDFSLLNKSEYHLIQNNGLNSSDAARFSRLYKFLFIDKHSKHNPVYTTNYFKEAIQNNWHHYVALKNAEGRIDAFISWFVKDNIMVCGPLGYDPDIDRKAGLYRQLVAICLKHANENQLIFNMGGGSDEFKSNRGSTETIEYTAVFCKHLPFYRQIPWKIMSWACNKFLKKIVAESSL